MAMHGGELIYETTDEYGKIQVVDFQQQYRSLHFGNRTQQSAMLLQHPYLLVHKYTQAMLVSLAWKQPENILILGLGSGAIYKFLHNYFSDIRVDAVELRSAVIDIAYEYFVLPEPDTQFRVFNSSAENWLHNLDISLKYDLVIIDMFLTTDTGEDQVVDISSIVDKLVSHLSDDSVISCNYLGDSIASYPAYSELSNSLPGKLYSINIDSYNTILLGLNSSLPEVEPTKYMDELQYTTHLRLHEHYKLITQTS